MDETAASRAAVGKLLVGKQLAAAKQAERLAAAARYTRRRNGRGRGRGGRSDDEEDEHGDYASASSADDDDSSASDSEQASAPAAAPRGRVARARRGTTVILPTNDSRAEQNPLDLLRTRAKPAEPRVLPPAAPATAAPAAAADAFALDAVWPTELTHAATADLLANDDVDWEADDGDDAAPSSAAAAAASSASAAGSSTAATAAARPDLQLQRSLSTHAATQPLDDMMMDTGEAALVASDSGQRAAWTVDNEEVLFGEDDEAAMADAAAMEEEEEPPAAAAAAAPAAAATPSVLSNPRLLNKVVLKAASTPAAPATASGAASDGPLEISFAPVSNEQVAAELRDAKYAQRVQRAQLKAAGEAAKLKRQQVSSSALAAATLSAPGSWITGEPLSDRKSTFLAHAIHVCSASQASTARAKLLSDPKLRSATHNMYAFAVRDPVSGVWRRENDDDGESGAGARLATLLGKLQAENILVVVSRWYGGVFLGVDRWKHINNLATAVIKRVQQWQDNVSSQAALAASSAAASAASAAAAAAAAKKKSASAPSSAAAAASSSPAAAASSSAAVSPAKAGSKRKADPSSTPSKLSASGSKKQHVSVLTEDDEEEEDGTGQEDELQMSEGTDDDEAMGAAGSSAAAASSSRKGARKPRAAAAKSLVPAGPRMTKNNKVLLQSVHHLHLASMLWLIQLHSSPKENLGILTDELLTARVLSIALNKCAGIQSKAYTKDARKPAVWIGGGKRSSSSSGAGGGSSAAAAAGAASPSGGKWKTSAGGSPMTPPGAAASPLSPAEGSVFARVQHLAYFFRNHFRCHGDRIALPRSDKNHPLHEYDARMHARMLNELRCTCVRQRVIHAAVKGQQAVRTDPWVHYKHCAVTQMEHALRTREGGFQQLTMLFVMLLRQQHVLARLCYGVPAVNYRKDMIFPPAAETAAGQNDAAAMAAQSYNDSIIQGLASVMDASFASQFGGGGGGDSTASVLRLFGLGGASSAAAAAAHQKQAQDPKALIVLATAAREKCACMHPFRPVTYGGGPSNADASESPSAQAAPALFGTVASPTTILSPRAASSSASAASAAVAAPTASSPSSSSPPAAAAASSQRKRSSFLARPENTIELLDSDDEAAAAGATVAQKQVQRALGSLAQDGKEAAATAEIHAADDSAASSVADADAPAAAAKPRARKASAAAASSSKPEKSKSAPSAAAAAPASSSRSRAAKSKAASYKDAGSGGEDEAADESAEDDEAEEDDVVCRSCGTTGEGDDAAPILLCDGCDGALCLACTDPPLTAVPKGKWLCPQCVSDGGSKKGTAATKGRKKPVAAAAPKKRASKAAAAAAAVSADDSSDVQEVSPASSAKKKRVAAPRKSRKKSADMDLTVDVDEPSAAPARKPRLSKSMSAAQAGARKGGSAADDAAAAAELDFDDGMSDIAAPAASSARGGSRSGAAASAAAPAKKQYFEHGYPLIWIEFYSPDEARWVHLDVMRSLIDSPEVYEHDGGLQLAYVIAVRPSSEEKGAKHLLSDVTKRYTRKWTALQAHRMDESAFVHMLSQYTGPCAPQDRDLENADASELAALHAASTAAMPTRLSEFKNHPLYVLEAFCKKFETIYPKGVEHSVGSFVETKRVAKVSAVSLADGVEQPTQGARVTHLVYPRSHLHVLHTADRWKREQRAVKDEELPHPMKIVKKLVQMSRRQREQKLALGLLNPDGEKSELYAIHQTVPWMPEAASGGIVPKNARGQVDVWGGSSAHVPPGCVHLPHPRLKNVCKRLGVDYAKAMVGFDVRGSRSVPRFDGVVVCAEVAQEVMDKWRAVEAKAEERAEKRRMDKIVKNWRRLVKAHVLRMQMQAQMAVEAGAGGGDAAAAAPLMPAAAAAPSRILESHPYGAAAVAVAQNLAAKEGAAVAAASGAAHIHVYDQRSFDVDTNAWLNVCACGARQIFEEHV